MTDQVEYQNMRSSRVRVKIVGVGGAGGNTVTRLVGRGLKQVEAICVNTDVQALEAINNAERVAIGWDATGGFGSGGRPQQGKQAANDDKQRIAEAVADADLVFVTAGMGGGTGTGAAPVVTELARKTGALTVGVVSTPFTFEGKARTSAAEIGLDGLLGKVDTLLVVENDKLLDALDLSVALDDAFGVVDDVLGRGLLAIVDTVLTTGVINIDFADVRTIMSEAGYAHMGAGSGTGEGAADQAASNAMASPLLNVKLSTSTRALINIVGGDDLTLGDVNSAAETIRGSLHRDAEVIVGVVKRPELTGTVNITLIATGLDRGLRKSRSRAEKRDRVLPAPVDVLDQAAAIVSDSQLSFVGSSQVVKATPVGSDIKSESGAS